ncbi:hypothetical protein [Polyangium aurulentum]|uniref:hypothetical protein n=1 Tax=Polyangium aurulentum TaxID=2567896 RepID=UPI0010AE57BD|nr:hypothetical protein [Polyangium aurulentum]UQA62768.1 hypothetical protein E8A73_020885 [Polyangium aurulentum]
MRTLSATAIFALAVFAMPGGCTCASPESPPEPTPGVSSALPAPTVAAAPTAVASAEPSYEAPDFSNLDKDDTGCPAKVEHPGIEGEIVGSWKEVLARLQAVDPAGGESPLNKVKPSASDAQIRQALTGKPDSGARVWLIPSGISMNEPSFWHVVGKRSDGKLALFLAISGVREFSICPGTMSVVLETKGMPRLIVEQEKQLPAPTEEFRYGCAVASHERTTIFLDVDKPDVPLTIEEKTSAENDAKPVWVKIVQRKDEVLVTGAGCDLKEPLRE